MRESFGVTNMTVHRWTIPFAGFLLAVMTGVSHTWGIFVIPLSERFGWTTAEATLPFTVLLVVFAIVMVPAGHLQDRLGPRKISAIGAALFFIAYGLAAMIGHFPYLWWMLLTYSTIGGIATGLTYACIAPPARKWYPDKPSTAISFGVMGVGLATTILAPLKADFLIPSFGIEGTLLTLAIVIPIISFLAVAMIKNPPEGWTAPKVTGDKTSRITVVREEVSPRELFGKTLFWVIWLSFAFVMTGGLMCIGLIPSYGERIVGLTSGEAAIALAVFAGFNGFGRLLAGMLADNFGIVTVMLITYIVQAITLLSFHIFAVTLPTLYIASALLGWGYAVTLAVFPALMAICFGVRNLGMNNGILFTAVAVGAFSPAVGAWLFDITGNYTPAFVSAGVLAVLAVILCAVLKKRYALA